MYAALLECSKCYTIIRLRVTKHHLVEVNSHCQCLQLPTRPPTRPPDRSRQYLCSLATMQAELAGGRGVVEWAGEHTGGCGADRSLRSRPCHRSAHNEYSVQRNLHVTLFLVAEGALGFTNQSPNDRLLNKGGGGGVERAADRTLIIDHVCMTFLAHRRRAFRAFQRYRVNIMTDNAFECLLHRLVELLGRTEDLGLRSTTTSLRTGTSHMNATIHLGNKRTLKRGFENTRELLLCDQRVHIASCYINLFFCPSIASCYINLFFCLNCRCW